MANVSFTRTDRPVGRGQVHRRRVGRPSFAITPRISPPSTCLSCRFRLLNGLAIIRLERRHSIDRHGAQWSARPGRPARRTFRFPRHPQVVGAGGRPPSSARLRHSKRGAREVVVPGACPCRGWGQRYPAVDNGGTIDRGTVTSAISGSVASTVGRVQRFLRTRSLNDPHQGSLWGSTGTGRCRESVPRVKRRKRCNGFLAIRRLP
jgi:hypothetical protein